MAEFGQPFDIGLGLPVGLHQDGMDHEVDQAVPGCLRREPFHQIGKPFLLARETDVADGGYAPGGSSVGSTDEIVRPRHRFPAHFDGGEVHVHVHASGQHELAGRVDFPRARHRAADLDDAPVDDTDVRQGFTGRGDHQAAAHHQIELDDFAPAHDASAK